MQPSSEVVLSRVLIANRGEIAVRVARTLRQLGIESVAVYSDADAKAPHVRAADRAVRLGPAPAAESYLHVERVIEAARATGADAIHPGYGFLSERPDFARACRDAGLAFVGPPPEAMALLGDKVAAKRLAAEAGVPVVPGTDPTHPALSDEEIVAWAAGQELPLLVKAAAGGGGKGMRIVRTLAELPEALGAARREAAAAFGDDRIFAERLLERPRHIEVQVIADRHGTILHLGERECSLQRRHQKVIEEAPSPVVDDALRARMGEAAVALARACGYVNAGTVELIADAEDPSSFFFLEVNARLQVEHPVTEAVTGLDLVELQLRIAAGEPLPLSQEDVVLRGHAVEARIYAEDPANGFLPSTGRVVAYREPGGASAGGEPSSIQPPALRVDSGGEPPTAAVHHPAVRVDSGIEEGSVVGGDYDPLLAKIVAHAPDRATALDRLSAALGELRVVGLTTNAPYLRALLARMEVRDGRLDTGLIERLGDAIAPPPPDPSLPALALVALVGEAASDDPWDACDGWRLAGRAPAVARLHGPDGDVEARACPDYEGGWIVGDGLRACWEPEGSRRTGCGTVALVVIGADGLARHVEVVHDGSAVWLIDDEIPTRWAPATDDAARRHVAAGSLEAPMPGVVLDVRVEAGAAVAEGDVLVVLESMKMELAVQAPGDGVVADVLVAAGERVARGQSLVVLDGGATSSLSPGEAERRSSVESPS